MYSTKPDKAGARSIYNMKGRAVILYMSHESIRIVDSTFFSASGRLVCPPDSAAIPGGQSLANRW
jgi:hypothetical protein